MSPGRIRCLTPMLIAECMITFSSGWTASYVYGAWDYACVVLQDCCVVWASFAPRTRTTQLFSTTSMSWRYTPSTLVRRPLPLQPSSYYISQPILCHWEQSQHEFGWLTRMFLLSSDVEKDHSPNMEDTIEHIKKLIGEPRNYGGLATSTVHCPLYYM